jgi:hypothetical protein
VALAISVAEATVSEEGPVLLDERGAVEARGIIGQHAEEDLLDDLIQQRWRGACGRRCGCGDRGMDEAERGNLGGNSSISAERRFPARWGS